MSTRLPPLPLPLPLALALLSIPGCFFGDGGGKACTDLAAASVAVTVSASDGGSLDGLAVTYSVDGVDKGACSSGFSGGEWICGYEEEGTIEVTATAPGYDTLVQSVEVGSDECHVIQEFMDLTMEPTEVACTEIAVVSVQVSLSGSSGEVLESPAVTWSADGSAPAPCDTEDAGLTWECGWEVAGDFVIAATAGGHVPVEATATVPMTEDGCHVITQQVEIALEWAPD